MTDKKEALSSLRFPHRPGYHYGLLGVTGISGRPPEVRSFQTDFLSDARPEFRESRQNRQISER
jgi:hypothetical protein